MDYLCLAVKKEAARSQTGSREQTQEWFFEKFGDHVRGKLEKEKKKLEGRVRYYDRKAETYKGEPEEQEEWLRRRMEAQREPECVKRRLEGEWDQLQVWSYEDKYECYDEIFDVSAFGGTVLMLDMAKVCRAGSGFRLRRKGISDSRKLYFSGYLPGEAGYCTAVSGEDKKDDRKSQKEILRRGQRGYVRREVMHIRLWPLCRRLFRQRDRADGWTVKEKTRNGGNKIMSYEEMDKKYGCTVENFIMDTETEYSICREERQYAVFLYNILRYYREPKRRCGQVKRIFKTCGIPDDARVKQVFYEAAFMRDFFERNRRLVLGRDDEEKMPDILTQRSFTCTNKSTNVEDAFNYKLMEYVHKGKVESWTDKDLRYNLGRYVPCAKLSEDEKFTVRCMMEAKPDLAVVYEKNGKEYLLFLECKFESGESSYSTEGSNKLKQSKIQWKIADFLCKTYLRGRVEVSESMKDESSRLVRFVRKYGEKAEEEIEIGDLVGLNGDDSMCQALLEVMEPEINKIKEQTIKETAHKEAGENAANMLKSGKFSPEEIKKYIPRLSVEEIKSLAEGLCLNADLNH